MRLLRVAVILTLVLAANAPVLAQFSCAPDEVALWPTTAEHVVVAGGLGLLTTEGQGVEVLDLSDPSQPALLAEIVVPGWNPIGSALLGDLALVLGTSADPTLWVFDLADPANPQLVGVNDQLPHAQNHIVAEGVLAVIGARHGIQVVDVSDPASPTLVASVAGVWSYSEALALRGTVAYADSSPDLGLVALDLADPSHPVVVGPLTDILFPSALSVSDSRLFVGDCHDWPTPVTILDISDPFAPVPVGEFWPRDGAPCQICAATSLLTALEMNSDPWGYNTFAWVSMWNVGSSTEPYRVGSRELPQWPRAWESFDSVACEGTLVYVIEDQGLQILDFAQCLLQQQQARVPALGPVGIVVMASLLALIGARLARGRLP